MEEQMKTIARTRRIGGSLVVTIPSSVVKEKQLEENEMVDFVVQKRKINGFGALKGIGSFTKRDRMEDRV